ncbi:MAG: UDP-N-acetylmuramate dehydrogenase [Fimbriimonadaceae bacterium]
MPKRDYPRFVSLAPFSTLRAGGEAEIFAQATSVDELADLAMWAQTKPFSTTYLGGGSNILPSDDGVSGFVVINQTSRIEFEDGGVVIADSGCSFQNVFLSCAQRGLGGLEFAVGIPGSLGGALVSNAGAYRSNISEFLTDLEIVVDGQRKWVDPSWMEFSYRDSILRRGGGPACALLRVKMMLPTRNQKEIYDEARDYQRQRIGKQPPPASAGSFFKNVGDSELAARLDNLPDGLKKAGVVPAGYLIERSGLQGVRVGGAAFARRHANFIVNIGGASATEIRNLADLGKGAVLERFGVALEEEVLYLGDWTRYRSRIWAS